ncbi:MAG: DNA translocase FtsK 4TM domain-containing protein, partial [Flavobacteriaceae bacterium]|nr:DNA translocase FtsK 4TM domain-containing protein [Flavobacteriaceae bacterium]
MAKKKQPKQIDPKIIRQRQVLFGGALLLLALLLTIAFISYLYSWKADYSTLGALTDRTVIAQNVLNKLGALISHFFIYQGVGLGAFLIPYLIGLSGYKLFFNGTTRGLVSSWAWGIAHILWTCLTFGYLWTEFPILSGIIGFEIHSFALIYIGRLGLLAILSFLFLCFIVIELGWTPEKMALWFQSLKKTETQKINEEIADEGIEIDLDSVSEAPTSTENLEEEIAFDNSADKKETAVLDTEPIAMEIEAPVEESVEEKLSKTLVEKQGFFDPTLELSNFKRPGIDLLKDYGDSGITINQEELEANKNKIVDTLNNYKIGIANIKATIGPTVTLYEI